MSNTTGSAFSHLVDVLARLRSPQGCPWDREQTHQSLKRNLLEESYEVLEAIDREDLSFFQGGPRGASAYGGLAEELGDVLLQILFHAQIASEAGWFSIDDVVSGITEKLVRRHPHVFGDAQVRDAREVETQWEELKRQERQGKPEESMLGKVPKETPSLAYSQLVQERASRAGFDWPNVEGVLEKVSEEVAEIAGAPTPEERAGELGDLLFSLVNACRWMGVHAEDALRQSNARFTRRFTTMERLARERGAAFAELPLAQKDALWEEAKGMG
ncbi:MAG: nucleoside triphosphate pyrophosphohydrolase [Chloroflexi bacterium]|nr:nucleoside triphosphate pyrophosphohydrolase [Chloroflexota bacterium]